MGDCAEMLLDGTLNWDGSYDPYNDKSYCSDRIDNKAKIIAYNKDQRAINKFLYEKMGISDYKKRQHLVKAYICYKFNRKASKNPQSKLKHILNNLDEFEKFVNNNLK